jgi:hypothetical protein
MSLSRRGLLRALPGLPVAARSFTGAIVQKFGAMQAATGLSELGGAVASRASCEPIGSYSVQRIVRNPILLGLKKLGLLPEWASHEVQQAAKQQYWRIDSDLASMRSMSPAVKMYIANKRRDEEVWDSATKQIAMNAARDTFFSSVNSEPN